MLVFGKLAHTQCEKVSASNRRRQTCVFHLAAVELFCSHTAEEPE